MVYSVARLLLFTVNASSPITLVVRECNHIMFYLISSQQRLSNITDSSPYQTLSFFNPSALAFIEDDSIVWPQYHSHRSQLHDSSWHSLHKKTRQLQHQYVWYLCSQVKHSIEIDAQHSIRHTNLHSQAPSCLTLAATLFVFWAPLWNKPQ